MSYIRRMRTIILLIAYAAALLVAPHSAVASTAASACYGVGSPDARAYCLAMAHRDPGRCYNIQSGGLRAVCLAEVRR